MEKEPKKSQRALELKVIIDRMEVALDEIQRQFQELNIIYDELQAIYAIEAGLYDPNANNDFLVQRS